MCFLCPQSTLTQHSQKKEIKPENRHNYDIESGLLFKLSRPLVFFVWGVEPTPRAIHLQTRNGSSKVTIRARPARKKTLPQWIHPGRQLTPKLQVPKMEVLNPYKDVLGVHFPCISRIHTGLYRFSDSSIFRYLFGATVGVSLLAASLSWWL